jgi:hypothetical protein
MVVLLFKGLCIAGFLERFAERWNGTACFSEHPCRRRFVLKALPKDPFLRTLLKNVCLSANEFEVRVRRISFINNLNAFFWLMVVSVLSSRSLDQNQSSRTFGLPRWLVPPRPAARKPVMRSRAV